MREALALQQAARLPAAIAKCDLVIAWNEWGTGCHLEPDTRFGRQYLEALRSAIAGG